MTDVVSCAVISVACTPSPSWSLSTSCCAACLLSSCCGGPEQQACCVTVRCCPAAGGFCVRLDHAWTLPVVVGCESIMGLDCAGDPASQAPRCSQRGAGWSPWSSLLCWCQVPLCSPGELGTGLLSGASSAQAKPWLGEDLWCVGCIVGLFPDASFGLSSLLILVMVQSLITILSAAALIPTPGTWLVTVFTSPAHWPQVFCSCFYQPQP